MTCDACGHFEATRAPARYNAGCLDCSARSLAHGPLCFASAVAGTVTDPYKAALQRVFGEQWKEGHQRVKAWQHRLNKMADTLK